MTAAVQLVTAALLGAALWSLLCRINAMDLHTTRPLVIIQHAALAMGVFIGALLPGQEGKLALAAGVAAYLLASSQRWRRGSPPGTDKSGIAPVHELHPQVLRQVGGGAKPAPPCGSDCGSCGSDPR